MPLDHGIALDHLRQADPVMDRLIRDLGPCGWKPRPRRPSFETLATAIANQQLSGKAADTILGRLVGLFPGNKFPAAADLALVTDDQIRAAGFSRAKTAALRDLAAKILDGTVPTTRQMAALSDDEVIGRLVQVRGIGRWTAEMLLMFQLGRPDVLPVDDLGVRAGFARAFGRTVTPKELLAHGEIWRPFRSVATWYLWRILEEKA